MGSLSGGALTVVTTWMLPTSYDEPTPGNRSEVVNESNFTRDALQAIKDPDSLTLKFADRFTAGIPDLWHVRKGRETWLELKAVNVDDNPIARVSKDKVQLQTAYRMVKHGARVFYVIAVGRTLTVWHPEYLVRRIITDLNFQWALDLPITCPINAPWQVLENFLKRQPLDPIQFVGGDYHGCLYGLNFLVETK